MKFMFLTLVLATSATVAFAGAEPGQRCGDRDTGCRGHQVETSGGARGTAGDQAVVEPARIVPANAPVEVLGFLDADALDEVQP